jgi:hypothetical protein
MQPSPTQHRTLRRLSPPSQRLAAKIPAEPKPVEDSFVRRDNDPVSWKALALAGISLLGVASCTTKPAEPVTQMLAWPEGDFTDVGLSGISISRSAATSVDMKEAVDWALERSLQAAPPKTGEDRHALGRRVQTRGQDRVQYDGSDVVVIAFEGTGGYHPRKAQMVQDAAARLSERGLEVDGSSGSLSALVSKTLDVAEGQSSGWSGLSRGPLEQLVRNPELSSRTQYLSFASEEVEALSGMDAFNRAKLSEVLYDSYESYVGQTPGIENAQRAVIEIQRQAKELGKNPRFLLVSHSSGGRSMVKFLEKTKSVADESGRPLQFSAAVMIDPVREAHEAFFEGGKELMAKGTEHNLNSIRKSIGVDSKEVHPPLVRHRSQPESLYKPSNLTTLVNYFQRQDTEGLKIRPLVGIQGSPVEGAQNLEITDVGTGGHGEIALHQEVREAFTNQIERLLNQSEASQTTP